MGSDPKNCMILAQRSHPIPVTRDRAWPLHGATRTRQIEQQALARHPDPSLMQRAGLAVAKLALAIAPHAERIWLACGAGNNGGDGLEAAIHLQRWGKQVLVNWLGSPGQVPADSQAAWERFQACGLSLCESPPAQWDCAIDGLLGIGGSRPPQGVMADWLSRMANAPTPLLQIDVASGLDAQTGFWHGRPLATQAQRHTLSLLTLKPGLFTADGRDASGEVWFDDLGVVPAPTADGWLQAQRAAPLLRRENSHKGNFGDVVVVGGDAGMSGAAVLAAQAALRGGAGRVWLGLLDDKLRDAVVGQYPTLMSCDPEAVEVRERTVVCGCGGGDAVRAVLPRLLSSAASLVLDADALNALDDPSLRQLLRQRTARHRPTVLTPHPLEAARLLGCDVQTVQSDRLGYAQALCDLTGAVVVLKGSGTIIAAPQQAPVINASGHPRLAMAGTGDVLAGLMGSELAQGLEAHKAACRAVARHGWAAQHWPPQRAFDAWALTTRLG